MARSPPEDFDIYVDPSCLSDRTKPTKLSKRHQSGQTIIHHDVDNLHSDHESQSRSQVIHDGHSEALIHATARAVVARIEQDGCGQEDSILSARTDESYEGGNELTYGGCTERTHGEESEQNYDFDADIEAQDQYDGSASSHHGDDVFSPDNGRSNRSSMNSITDEETHTKASLQEDGQNRDPGDALNIHSLESPTSRASSHAFSIIPEPYTITSSYTPSKSPRPPFRTPSSIRAMQMSSPTPSEFGGSPSSNKRSAVTRLRTPQAQNQSPTKNKTPTRFKEKAPPLVLLHVTVLALHWPYAAAMDEIDGEGLPRELQTIRESWKLLQEKLGDTVLERGILLPHPQDSYEVLEERILEALELPVRPRAKILSCGHFMGPDDLLSEGESENEDGEARPSGRGKWCDICSQEVKYEEFGVCGKQKRFRVKVYASNGLMTAGSWAAAWREMERVDIEMVPFVPSHLVHLMDSLAASHLRSQDMDRSNISEEHANERPPEDLREPEKDEVLRRREMEEERLREVYGDELPEHSLGPEEPRPQRPRSARQQRQYGDSLPELLFAAFKVAMQDKRNILIATLSVLVLGLAIRGRPAPEVVFHTDPISSSIERNIEIIQETPSLVKEVSSMDVQTIRAPTLAKEVSSMDGQTIRAPTLAEEVSSMDGHTIRADPDPKLETATRVAEPLISVPDEDPVQFVEYKAKEQPPTSVSKPVAITTEDPCREYKQQLASRDAVSAKLDSPVSHRSEDDATGYQTMAAPDTAL